MSAGAASAAARAAVNHCPFCGESDLRPTDAEHVGDWYCRSCLRLFAVTPHGLRRTIPTEDSP
ncbi:MAG: hypothetical protein U0Q19_22750 [Kineosporiaceae bacterium]